MLRKGRAKRPIWIGTREVAKANDDVDDDGAAAAAAGYFLQDLRGCSFFFFFPSYSECVYG